MAQLIKLKDYVSRYEWNAFRYPSRYIRLKQDNWDGLYDIWRNSAHKDNVDKQSRPILMDSELLPESEIELRQYFLDMLFPLQLKWATSTVTDVSFIDKKHHYDDTLKYFLQRFPDIYLMMYYPIFNINKTTIDGEIILISPIGIEIIYLMEDSPQATILAGDDRTWMIERGITESKVISPLIALKRTEHIIKRILNTEKIDFAINKLVISRTNNIVFSSEPYNTKIIGKFQFEKWFTEKRQLRSSLKGLQLKAVEALLKHCLTTSIKRPEWEEGVNANTSDSEEK